MKTYLEEIMRLLIEFSTCDSLLLYRTLFKINPENHNGLRGHVTEVYINSSTTAKNYQT
jgi:effector-binding domain-containing protein